MQCVVLVGGLGTRMRPLTARVPKALLPVAGRPFIDHQLELLARQGFADIVLSIGHRGEMIRDFVGDGSRWRVRVAYADEGEELRGTAGALRLADDRGLLEDAFAVLYGDSYLPIDVREVREAFEGSERPALMTVYRNRGRWEESNVEFADGIVQRYQKNASDPTMQYVDYGLSWLQRTIISDRVAPGMACDLADVFGSLSRERLLAGFEVLQRFYEVGSRAGLADLDAYLTGAAPGRPEHAPDD